MSYSVFASYYDRLTENVNYKARAAYLCELMRRFSHEPGLMLDLACGTGSLTMELYKMGLDIYGIDGSADMLSVAGQKTAEAGYDILFLCQKMQQLDLFGTVDTVICALDSVNHITSEIELQKAFDRISLFMNPQGLFIFDANTLFKHKQVLSNNTFVYDTKDVYCVWQNSFDDKTNRVAISLDFFERRGNAYTRSSERFYERAYSTQQLTNMLTRAGFEVMGIYDDMTFDAPQELCERMTIAARKV
jgi:2-polyprenyl-3-methyl-5-hydroxy-6-metoxy-1,4-benzoquinol methylase